MIRSGAQLLFRYHQLLSTAKDPLQRMHILDDDIWIPKKAVLIVSSGRTGTHFLGHFFQENFDKTFSIHEPKPDCFDINQHLLRKDITPHRAGEMFKMYRRDLFISLKQEGYVNYVESNPNILALIPVLKNMFQKCRVVHIVRDGKEVVRSLYSRDVYGKWSGTVPFFSDRDPRERLNAQFFPDDPYHAKWETMSRFERICWIWAKKNALLGRFVKNDPHARTYKFSSLFVNKNPDVWEDLINFTGLKEDLINQDYLDYVAHMKSNAVKQYLLPEYEDWPDHYKDAFEEIAGPQMERYGYDI